MINDIISAISNFMYTYLLIILLLAGGLYFTFRTRFVQFRMFRESLRVVGERPERAGSVSSFQALMVSTASRVGTGNIIGVHRRLWSRVLDVADCHYGGRHCLH